jgi:diguanylate cyclase (GGDEF)-like protein
MSLTYCERYNFDNSKIEERLQWLQLEAADHNVAAQLQQDIIQPHVTEIIEAFYAWLVTLDAAHEILVDDELIAQLQVSQQEYLLTLGVDFTKQEYFEARLRVGQAHVWVGLSLSLYQCAYRYLGQLILERIDPQQNNAPELTRFVHKIIALDMSLAIETYHLARVESLEESLGRAKTQQLRLRMAARTDSLTGLANHETIMAELEEALQQSPPPELVVAMVDIDFFKKVNDTYGHLVGDKVLTEVTLRMRAALRGVDSIGRYGGEEFMLLIYGASLEVAQQVAERVRKHVAIEPVNLQGLEIPITLSLGLSKAQAGEPADVLLARADQALYAAKSAGRNQIQISKS